MVEILTAVAVIGILAAMFLIGFNKVSAASKEKATRTRMETLRNMLNEFEVKGGRMQLIDDLYPASPAVAGWTTGSQAVMPKGSADEATGNRKNDPDMKKSLDATTRVMHALTAAPGVKSIFDGLPQEAVTRWTVALPSPPAPPNTSLSAPLVLDAWNNPILYAPRRISPRPADPAAAAPNPANRPTNDQLKWGAAGLTGVVTEVKPEDGKGLWVSAGPDEDYSTTDDNLYSYDGR
jgi:type II secretory pathway pseudopilin PulG